MKIRWYILDANHHPVPASLMEWAEFLGDEKNRTVNWTQVTSQVHVSTIFLGIDLRPFGNGPPLLFETMIFGGALDRHMWRCSSWDDAEAGHQAAGRKARANLHSEVT